MMAAASTAKKRTETTPPVMPKPEVRHAVRGLLLNSLAFSKLPLETQRQIAHDMTQVADYLATPEGIPGNELPSAKKLVRARALDDPAPDKSASTYKEDLKQVNAVGDGFKASAAEAGADVAGRLLDKVNFPTFVASLIEGVFHAIVHATIEQMEAYGKLVSSVATSLNQFRDDNVSEIRVATTLWSSFQTHFEIGMDDGGDPFGGGGGGPRVKLTEGVDEDRALSKVNASIPMEGGPLQSLDMSDPDTETKLVQGARTQLPRRQQLLATMVLMGINRIVITDGKIQAKILYDFTAKDNSKRTRSAAAFDYARDSAGNLQKTRSVDRTWDNKTEGGETKATSDKDSSDLDKRDANYYTKGTYNYAEKRD